MIYLLIATYLGTIPTRLITSGNSFASSSSDRILQNQSRAGSFGRDLD